MRSPYSPSASSIPGRGSLVTAGWCSSCAAQRRRQRESIGLSQEDFAEKANVHRTYISSIELGKVSVGLEVANSLAVALGLKFSELIRRAE